MYNINRFINTIEQPKWAPVPVPFDRTMPITQFEDSFVFEQALSAEGCQKLINDFDQQEVYAVGVDGYCNGDEKPGSYRAMGWSPDLAEAISKVFERLPKLWTSNRTATRLYSATHRPMDVPFNDGDHSQYKRLGSTPWMRFMRYESGGMHVPHYDASFLCEAERYRTLYSWVLYLNDVPTKQGGAFQFIDDGNREPPHRRPKEAFADWHNMADPQQVMRTVQPKAGLLLVFPHWLCHQVQAFTASEECPRRYIIRGDVAYGIV